jgi:ankyrin repeat protein
MITDLLEIGAVAVGMKDSSGGTALFVAAESGYAHACELLLQGGADVLASNRAGETPLYIAALRGHSAAVGIMLAHCHEHGVNWQDADVYGDGWTPLMAAAVADRRNVGEMLLRAAGNELGLGFTQKGQSLMSVGSTVLQETDELKDPDVAFDKDSPTDSKPGLFGARTLAVGLAEDCNAVCTSQQLLRLLNRQNRYGQTALHIAVQKGSVWFIERLLSAGASLDVPNAYGLRAVDVAKRYNHAAIADKLRAWEFSQPKETCMVGDKKSRQNRKRRGKSSRVTSVHQNLREQELNVDCSGTKAMALGRHNCERPNCSDGAQSSVNVGDVQQGTEERIPERGMFLFGTDVNPENGARSDHIAQNVRLSAQEAILDQSPVPR